MSNLRILQITAESAAFEQAVRLFDQYRQFYGQASELSVCRSYLHDRLSHGESTVLLATVNEQTVAFAQLYPGFSSIACRKTLILNDMFVSPAHRSEGIGQRLVEASICWARSQGAASIQLETAHDNAAAQRLYDRLGFVRAAGFVSYGLRLNPC
jgi:GNAT superfamily N-acetyltransferase